MWYIDRFICDVSVVWLCLFPVPVVFLMPVLF